MVKTDISFSSDFDSMRARILKHSKYDVIRRCGSFVCNILFIYRNVITIMNYIDLIGFDLIWTKIMAAGSVLCGMRNLFLTFKHVLFMFSCLTSYF